MAGSAAYADTLNTGGGFNTSTGNFSAFNLGTQGFCTGGVCTDGTPFFNNTSGDTVNGSNAANAGNFLSATGGFGSSVAGCPTCGVNYMASGGQMYTQSGNSPNFASAFSFISQTSSISMTLLYANSGMNNNAEFGLYDASSQANALSNHEIVQPGGVNNLNNDIGTTYFVTNNYATYGIYALTCDASAPTGACPNADIVTFYSNVAMNGVDGDTPAADANHMHWALFQSGTNTSIYYLALEDFAIQTGTRNPVEGYGDYNDIILELNTSPGQTPEPATFSIVALSLAGLGWLRSRKMVK
ncbi:MAG TPA: PEP-CTERM sorting domain-containing protein [Bryobacteraceae bacterium]|nr:PEP-CTERM sorting domain-containing protein [Bryobacteraceae bacterium]